MTLQCLKLAHAGLFSCVEAKHEYKRPSGTSTLQLLHMQLRKHKIATVDAWLDVKQHARDVAWVIM